MILKRDGAYALSLFLFSLSPAFSEEEGAKVYR